MRLLLMLVFTITSVAGEQLLYCHPRLCFNVQFPYLTTLHEWHHQRFHDYNVEGHIIQFQFVGEGVDRLFLNCNGWPALDFSTSMPKFRSEFSINILTLENCPPPTNQSFADTFKTINVTLQHLQKLWIIDLPASPKLTGHHFNNLSSLIHFRIESKDVPHPWFAPKKISPEAAPGFLIPLQCLQRLSIEDVKVSLLDLENLAPSLKCLGLSGDALVSVPKTLRDTLRLFPQAYRIWLGSRYPAGLSCPEEQNRSSGSSVQEVILTGWKEDKMDPLYACDSLRQLTFKEPDIGSLPERFVAACPYLQEITISDSRRTISMPSNVLEGSSIRKLVVSNSDLVTPDSWWLKYARNLEEVHLPWNRITVV